jgi:hypothetical protein
MKKLAITSSVVYVLAWIVGLVIASGGPKPDDSAAKVASYYARHEHRALTGHLLVDGVAGIALVAIAFLIRRYVVPTSGRLALVGFYAALAAAVVSLVQFAIGATFTYDAAHGGSARTVRDLFVTLNNADTVKILFLAVMIAAVSLAARDSDTLPGWFVKQGLITAPLLAISGFAFPFDSGVLLALLELTLVLLLIWVAVFAALVARSSAGETAPETSAVATP